MILCAFLREWFRTSLSADEQQPFSREIHVAAAFSGIS
jgi:hypothetical protein